MKRTSDLFAWGWAGTGERARYSELTILSAEAAHVACHKPFLFDKLKAALEDIIASKDIEENEHDSQQRVMNEGAFEPNRNHVLIRDPVKVSTKGAPKQNSKSRGKDGPDVTKNGQPKAFDERSGRLCGLCRLPGHIKGTCPQNPKNMA